MGAPKNTTSTGQPAKYSDDVGTLFVGTLIALDGTLNVTGGIKATGVLTSVGLEVNIDGAVGTNRDLEWSTTPLLDRWIARANSTAEGGADAGSDFELIAFKDDGATIIDRPLTCTRAAGGILAFNRQVNVNSGFPLNVISALTTLEKDAASAIGVNLDNRNLGAFNAANAVRRTWTLNNSTPAATIFADETLTSTTPTAGTEAATWALRVMVAGALTTAISVAATAIVTFPLGVVVTAGGLTVSAGGLTVSAGGATFIVTGAATQVTDCQGNDGVNGALSRWFDAANAAVRGFVGYGPTIFTAGAISDFGIRSQGAVKIATGGGTVAVTISAAQATTFAALVTISTGGLTVTAGTITFNLGGGTGIVTAGAADSAGAGFRLLRVPN